MIRLIILTAMPLHPKTFSPLSSFYRPALALAVCAAIVTPFAAANLYTAVGALAAGAALIDHLRNGTLDSIVSTKAAALVAVLLAWMGFSLAWTIKFEDGLDTWIGVGGLLIAWLCLAGRVRLADQNEGHAIGWLMAFALPVAALLAWAELSTQGALFGLLRAWGIRSSDWSVTQLNRPVAYINLLLWPLAYFLWHQARGIWLARLFILVIPLWSLLLPAGNFNATARFAPVLGLVACVLALQAPRLVIALAGAGMVILTLAAPALALWLNAHPDAIAQSQELFRYSLFHRLNIWMFVSERIAEAPLLGWGLDSSRSIPGGQNLIAGGGAVLGLHPHNFALQLWLELGVMGALIGVMAILFLLRGLWFAQDRPACAFGLGAMVTAYAIAMASYGLWQSHWLALLGLLFALFRFQMTSCAPRL